MNWQANFIRGISQYDVLATDGPLGWTKDGQTDTLKDCNGLPYHGSWRGQVLSVTPSLKFRTTRQQDPETRKNPPHLSLS